jgi:allene oxide cyclase-like protein
MRRMPGPGLRGVASDRVRQGFDMRRRYAVAGLAVAIGTGVWALPSASAGDREDDDHDDRDGRVFRVISREVDSAEINLGPPAFGLGDRFVFTDNLYRRGKRVGTDHGECVTTRIESQGQGGTFQCLVTAVFRRGQITAQGAVTFSDDTSPFRVAITGGTGKFRDAAGQVVVDESAATYTVLTFQLED